jgi:hypothetical protein
VTGVLLGMTRGEALLTAFVFALVYGGVLLPRLGERVGVFFAGRRMAPRPGDGGREG